MPDYEYEIGPTSATTNIETLGIPVPRGEFYYWSDLFNRGDGQITPHGTPKALWKFDTLRSNALTALRAYCPQKTNLVWIKTRLPDGTYAKFQAIMEWPEGDMEKKQYGDVYMGLEIPFRRLRWFYWWLAGGLDPAFVDGAYQAIGASSQAGALVNLNDPGVNDLTAPVSPAWTSSLGWDFNGTTQYLQSAFPPATNRSIFVRYSTTNANNTKNGLMGTHSGASNALGIGVINGSGRGSKGGAFNLGVVGTSGVVAIVKYSGDTQHHFYYNGTKSTISDTGSITSAYNIPVGRTLNPATGAVYRYYLGYAQAALILNTQPTENHAIDIQNAMLLLG